jgi:large subunit ribosomal protein L17
MHRHGYKGRKFHRERDQREALIKSLAESLIIHEKIETTIFKAKELVPYVEKLITKAKLNTLHSRRQVIKGLQTVSSAHKLVDELAPKLQSRNSGYFRISRTTLRRGDNAQLASVSFILDDNKVTEVKEAPKPKAESKPSAAKTSVAKKPVAKAKPAAKAAPKSKEVK